MPYKTKSDLPDSVQHVLLRTPRKSIKKPLIAPGSNIKIKTIVAVMPAVKNRAPRGLGGGKNDYEKGTMINGIKSDNPMK
jgi:hypothetical protein